MTMFGDWAMPVQYTGIVEEHEAVRKAAGLFDISHMGEFFVRGTSAADFLNRVLSNDVAKLAAGQGQYTLMCNEQGGVIDDLILYRLAEDDYFLVVNAAKIAEDEKYLTQFLPAGVSFENVSARYAALALQGPKALAIARKVFGAAWHEPKRNAVTHASWNCQDILTARTGYTGEDGLELFFAPEIAENFFNALLKVGEPEGLKPCGLGARDTLRLEAGLPLNGNDLSLQHSALAAGLEPFLGFAKDPIYPGKNFMLEQKAAGARFKLAGFRVPEGPPPRPHYHLFFGADAVGEVTSGAPSPTLGCGIGLAYLRADVAAPGTRLEMEVRERRVPVEVVKKPFYKRPA